MRLFAIIKYSVQMITAVLLFLNCLVIEKNLLVADLVVTAKYHNIFSFWKPEIIIPKIKRSKFCLRYEKISIYICK